MSFVWFVVPFFLTQQPLDDLFRLRLRAGVRHAIGGAGVTLLSPAFQTNYNLPGQRWTVIGNPGENRGYQYRSVTGDDPIQG